MAEVLDLTVPVTKPSVTTYRVVRLVLNMDSDAYITITLLGSDGSRRDFGYTGPQAVTLMASLNKANLSTKSLQRRILEQLALDFPLLAGAVSGAPD